MNGDPMLHQLLSRLDRLLGFPPARAHCDIPCKIYDPISAQLAALTVIRLLDIMQDLTAHHPQLAGEDLAQFMRLVAQKEEHAAKVKDEVRVIWGDYFKAPQFAQVPGVHDLVHQIMLQASKCKQGIAREEGLALLKLVNQFTEAFWLTKGVATFTADCPYPPAQPVVYPKLGT